MTTHNVEIRPKPRPGITPAGGANGWQLLTRTPIARVDAYHLVRMIGELWEARIVALESPMGTDFAELERLIAVAGHVAVRWTPVHLNHHPTCGAPAIERNGRWVTRELAHGDVFTGSQWLALEAIKRGAAKMAGDGVAVYPGLEDVIVTPVIVHHGYCETCRAEGRGLSVQVRILRYGEAACAREYLLP